MARDYAKAKHKNAPAPARWRWLLIGLVIGFGVAGVMYLKFNLNNIESASTWLNEHSKPANNPTSKPLSHNNETSNKPVNVTAKDKLHFDFYTVLPKMEVKSEAKAAPKMQTVEPVATVELPAKSASASGNDHPTTTNNSGALKQAETSLLAPPASSSKKDMPITNHDDETNSSTTATKASTTSTDTKPAATTSHKKTETTTATANESASISTTTSATSNTNQIIQVGSFQKYESADQLRAQLTMIGVDAHIKSVKEHGTVWKKVWLGPFSSAADLAKVQKQLQENGIKGSIKPYSP